MSALLNDNNIFILSHRPIWLAAFGWEGFIDLNTKINGSSNLIIFSDCGRHYDNRLQYTMIRRTNVRSLTIV